MSDHDFQLTDATLQLSTVSLVSMCVLESTVQMRSRGCRQFLAGKVDSHARGCAWSLVALHGRKWSRKVARGRAVSRLFACAHAVSRLFPVTSGMGSILTQLSGRL